jgi:hypothetical protein
VADAPRERGVSFSGRPDRKTRGTIGFVEGNINRETPPQKPDLDGIFDAAQHETGRREMRRVTDTHDCSGGFAAAHRERRLQTIV